MHTDVAYLLRIPETKVLENLIELKQLGFLDDAPNKRFMPHNWSGRQYKSDSSAERMRRHRERRRDEQVTSRDGHGDVPEQRQIQKQNRTETEQSGGCLRAAEFAAAFPDQSNQNATVREYLSLVSASEEDLVFACLERYTRSAQVSDGKVQAGWKWLRAQKENGWKGDWPEVKIAANGIDRKVAAYLKRKHEEDEENAG